MAVALVFGIDVSGCPESGNYKYMAVFICTEEFLNVVVRRLQLNTVGGGFGTKKKNRKSILDSFKFNSRECLALYKDRTQKNPPDRGKRS